jgi:hypothetical protein
VPFAETERRAANLTVRAARGKIGLCIDSRPSREVGQQRT